MKTYPSIFNNALAPITAGPSSSNTSGPYRIGSLTRQISGGVPKKLELDLAASTNYASTFFGSRSDLALINGLTGKKPDDPDFFNAYIEAGKYGMDISFDMTGWPGYGTIKGHRIRITDNQGQITTIIADSTEGGTVRIMDIDGCPADIQGDHYELLIFVDKMPVEQMKEFAGTFNNEFSAVNHICYTEG